MVPLNALAFDGGSFTMVEQWKAYPEFRWAVPAGTSTAAPRLQQGWMSNLGKTEWRDVPTVVVE